jgi:hypothetical protein
MSFRLAKDVRKELERRSRVTKRDPNEILRELLEMPGKEPREPGQGGPADKTVVPAQRFYTPARGDRPPWGRIVMRRK